MSLVKQQEEKVNNIIILPSRASTTELLPPPLLPPKRGLSQIEIAQKLFGELNDDFNSAVEKIKSFQEDQFISAIYSAKPFLEKGIERLNSEKCTFNDPAVLSIPEDASASWSLKRQEAAVFGGFPRKPPPPKYIPLNKNEHFIEFVAENGPGKKKAYNKHLSIREELRKCSSEEIEILNKIAKNPKVDNHKFLTQKNWQRSEIQKEANSLIRNNPGVNNINVLIK